MNTIADTFHAAFSMVENFELSPLAAKQHLSRVGGRGNVTDTNPQILPADWPKEDWPLDALLRMEKPNDPSDDSPKGRVARASLDSNQLEDLD
jgi:hypothetical protein